MASLIQQFRTEIHGQLSDRRRVIDHLLDLRLELGGRREVVAEIDRLLTVLPGLTTVDNVWWAEALDGLDQLVSAEPTRLG